MVLMPHGYEACTEVTAARLLNVPNAVGFGRPSPATSTSAAWAVSEARYERVHGLGSGAELVDVFPIGSVLRE
ncbi:hypothetical protein Asi02nite_75180 [Asanoa siamensis]|uniref:Uncharacterized protein n=1 Tax=Asanoa siamensis TaxID=926357 RepID=A0ABQ4D385_9ACTN|nr:hypothetical protein Asi02nite_75180 [Asanoa siamensis]